MEHGYRPGDPAYRRITIALFAGGLGTFAMTYCTQPLLPLLAKGFGVTPATSALSVSATTIGLGAALLVLGPLSEVFGRLRFLHVALLSSAIVTLLTAVAPTWPVLLALRLLVGLTIAGLPAVAVAYLREEIHPAAMVRVTGLYIGGTALGGMLGRFVAAAAAQLWGWRAAIGAIGVLGLVCAVIVALLLPRSRGFVAIPLRAGHLAAMTRRVATDPALLALYGIGFTSMGAFVATFNAMGFRLEAPPYALPVAVAGLVFAVYALGSVSSTVAGHLADRVGVRAVVPWTILVALAGLLATLASPLPALIAGLGLLSVGFFACHGVVSGWVASRAAVGGPGASQASSLYLFAYYAGSSLAGFLVEFAWTGGGWPPVVALTGGLLVAALALSLALRRIPSLLEPKAPDPGVVAQ